MPYNIKGKRYDYRPYVDELGWLVINRGANIIKFKFRGKRLIHRLSGYHHIDKYDLEMARRQARILIPKLVNKNIE